MNNLTDTQNFDALKKVDDVFSYASMDLIQKWCAHYGECFLNGEMTKLSLSDKAREKWPFILSNFCYFCYRYHLQKPGQWTVVALKDVCTNIMPREIIADDAVFSLIVPELQTFLAWLSSENHFSNTDALQEALLSIESTIAKNADNPNFWSPGKSVAMDLQSKGYDMSNPHAIKEALMRENADTLLQSTQVSRKHLKQCSELKTIADIVDDLRYLTIGFPKAAVQAALEKQQEITPFLLNFLHDVLRHDEPLHENYFGHLYALFLLSFFREKQSCPLVIKMASLPEDLLDNLLGDCITEDLHRIIASIYDGHIEAIQALIEDPTIFIWSRNAALRSLLALIKATALERDWVVTYFKTLFHHDAFVNDMIATTRLIDVACDLYPAELYEDIKMAFEKNMVDTSWFDLTSIDRIIAMGQEEALAKYLYGNGHYDLIDDVIKELECWPCFKYEDDYLAHKSLGFPDFTNEGTNAPDHRKQPKVGRNANCPCGSGKKYKKCCLQQTRH